PRIRKGTWPAGGSVPLRGWTHPTRRLGTSIASRSPMNTELVRHSPPTLIPRDDALNHVRAVARLMDTAFVLPGTRFRIGLDPLLGLIPGIGDLIGAAISTYIVLVAAELGVSRAVILRMFLNIAID